MFMLVKNVEYFSEFLLLDRLFLFFGEHLHCRPEYELGIAVPYHHTILFDAVKDLDNTDDKDPAIAHIQRLHFDGGIDHALDRLLDHVIFQFYSVRTFKDRAQPLTQPMQEDLRSNPYLFEIDLHAHGIDPGEGRTQPLFKCFVYTTAPFEEQVLIKEAHTVWKKGRGLIEKVDDTTGEIMCLVEVPAQYKTVRKRVLVNPATVKEVTIPAEYKTVKVKKLVELKSRRPSRADLTVAAEDNIRYVHLVRTMDVALQSHFNQIRVSDAGARL